MKRKTAAISKMLSGLTSAEPRLLEGAEAKSGTERLWTDSDFLNWLGSNGVEVSSGKVPPYAEGGVGRAYFLGDKVVKFTDNRVEANVANIVSGRRDLPTRVDSVYKVPGAPIYAILGDKLNMNFPKTMGHAADVFMAYTDETGIESVPDSEEERQRMASMVASSFGEPKHMIPYFRAIIDMHHAMYKGTGYFHTDAMPQNLGLDAEGNPVMVDLGPHKHTGQGERLSDITSRRSRMGLQPVAVI